MTTTPLDGVEAVHLDEELVERLILIGGGRVAAPAATAPERVDLVDEDDARREFPRLREEAADARGAEPRELLLKARTGDGEERHLRLARRGAREQRLARARRAGEQDAARRAAPQTPEAFGVAQEINRLREFVARLVHARHVRERHVLFAARVGELQPAAAAHARVDAPADDAERQEHDQRDGVVHRPLEGVRAGRAVFDRAPYCARRCPRSAAARPCPRWPARRRRSCR